MPSKRTLLLIIAVALQVCAGLSLAGPHARRVVSPEDQSILQGAGCPGDFDASGRVDFADFLAFAGGFGKRSGDADYNAAMDMDDNGAVDFSDFLVFAGQFGETCDPPATPPQPEKLWVSGRSPTRVTWSWTPVEAADGYEVQFRLDDDRFTEDDTIVELTAAKRSYTMEPLAAGVTVYLRVRSFVVNGAARVVSAWSAPVSGSPLSGSESDQGHPLWVTYDPPAIRADHAGNLSLDLFVAGDVKELYFRPFDRTPLPLSMVETWKRASIEHIDGHVVSVFREELPPAYVTDFLGSRGRGFFPDGELHVGSVFFSRPKDPSAWSPHQLKIVNVPMNVPRSRVERIGSSVQYASHVVNLRISDFGNRRVSNPDWDFDLSNVTRLFYEHFADEYDTIAIGHGVYHIKDNRVNFNRMVRNPVHGLGRDVFDNSAEYGSNSRLRSVQHYANLSAFYGVLTHEIAHNWWDFWDWEGLTGLQGIDRSHGPTLMFPGLLTGGRIVRIAGEDRFMLEERPPDEWGFRLKEPHILYRMGLIEPTEVPDMLVFEDQGQWTNLAFGDRISGGFRRVNVNDIIARHGPRRGPVDRDWRLAMVVVSLDRLLSQDEMNYWNFIVARQEALVGPPGDPSYYQSTDGKARLYTEITPKTAPKIVNDPEFATFNLPIDSREFPGVQLDEPLPASIRPGNSISIAGKITHAAFARATTMCAVWNRLGLREGYVEVKRECVPVAGGRFSTTFTFTEGDAGIYSFSLRASGHGADKIEAPGYSWPGTVTGIEITDRAN